MPEKRVTNSNLQKKSQISKIICDFFLIFCVFLQFRELIECDFLCFELDNLLCLSRDFVVDTHID